MVNVRKIWMCGLAGICLLSVAVLARGQGACGLDARNQWDTAFPVVGPGMMSAELAADFGRTYRTVGLQYQNVQGMAELKKLRERAVAEKSVCGQALADFGLGQAARYVALGDAIAYYEKAQEGLKQVGTPLALVYVRERIAATAHFVGHNDVSLRDLPKVIEDMRAAGDEPSSVVDESTLLEWKDDSDTTLQQEALLKRLDAMQGPAVVAVKGLVERNLGGDLRRASKVAEAVTHLHKAMEDLVACDCSASTQAVVHLELAHVYDQSNDQAGVLREALEGDAIYKRYHLDSFRPQALRLMANAQELRGDYRQEIATLQEALRLAHEAHSVFAEHNLVDALAGVYGLLGQPLKGIAVVDGLDASKQTPAQHCVLQGRIVMLGTQAKLYERVSSVAAAMNAAKCSERMASVDFAQMTWSYAEAQLRLGNPVQAAELARQAVGRIEIARAGLETTDRNLVAFNAQQVSAYTVLIESLIALHKNEEALLATEQYRARGFVDLALTARDDAPGNVSSNGSKKELTSEIHPFTLTVGEIRKRLEAPHSTLLSYWVGEGRLYTWVMSAGKPVYEKDRPVNVAQLDKLVRATLPVDAGVTRGAGAKVRTRGGQAESLAEANRQPWRELYQLLIAPVAAELPKNNGDLLTIVPQSSLFGLSFAALTDNSGRYLVEKYAVHTVPSAGVLQITTKNDAAATSLPSRYLIVANPDAFPSINGRSLPALPGTDAEAKGIARQLGNRSVTLLEGKQAGITSMMASLGAATTLHLATHAVVRDDEPMTSFLALDRSQKGGMLTAASVYGLHLHANLVVLSACGTGRGKISGDGVAGLSRAFLYAGAASLVTTLWDVVDEPTARLMPTFYRGLVRGESRSAALRNAQLQLIQDLRQGRVRVTTLDGSSVSLPENPAYWAAFSLSGQP